MLNGNFKNNLKNLNNKNKKNILVLSFVKKKNKKPCLKASES